MGWFSIYPVLCSPQVLQPEPPLLSCPHPRHRFTPVISISVPLSSPPVWRGSAGDIFKTDDFTLKQTSFFLKIASLMMLSNISAFASLKLTSFKSLLKEWKKISSKLGVAFQGMLQGQARLQAAHSMNSGSEEISSNCSVCTFCACLHFELHFSFLH